MTNCALNDPWFLNHQMHSHSFEKLHAIADENNEEIFCMRAKMCLCRDSAGIFRKSIGRSFLGAPQNQKLCSKKSTEHFSIMFRYVCTQAVVIVLLFNHIFVFLAFSRGRGSNIFVDSAVTDGRHSYSLTTFDPDGKLGQVERALLAESLGTPIVGVVKGNNIILASPQILPSPLMDDDGTSRFVVASPQIVLGHSGIASDGRVVTESAQRLAIEHSYTYNEPIPIYLFLEEISLLFQAYTAKPGARPFGCTLLVGYLPAQNPTGGNRFQVS